MDATGPVVVGKPEIAEMLGVARGTPDTWQRRQVLPDPDHPRVNGLAAWWRTTIETWALETGRMPDRSEL